MTKRVLHLVLKRKYFERIYNRTKLTEYRNFTSYWQKRIESKHYTHIKFQLAYSKNPPTMLVEVLDRNIVDYKGVKSYAFDLGKIIEVNNYE
tara:strand:+ start:341 stop:616 length:276 start_codon:yes stop_codon:yes gene_type:complete